MHTRLRRIAAWWTLAAVFLILALLAGMKFATLSSRKNPPLPEHAIATLESPSTAISPQSAPSSSSAPAPPGLHYVMGPADGIETARAAALRFDRAGEPSSPLPVYNLTLRLDTGLQYVTDPGRFMYFIVSNGKHVASVTVASDSPTGTSRMVSMAMTPRVDVVQALDRLSREPRMRTGSFEPRLLLIRIPTGNLYQIIWLKAPFGPQDDLLYPFATYYQSGIQPGTFYTPEELFKLLVPARASPPPAVTQAKVPAP